ncbi:MAG: DMT family transporter [Kiloniellales bacterium]
MADAAQSRSGERIGLGIASIIAAIFFFSVMDGIAKWLGQSHSAIQIAFFRNLFGLLPVALIIWQGGGVASLRTRRPWAHALRAALIWLALVTFFAAISLMPLAEAVAIAFAAPLFVTALSRPIVGEPVGPRRWAAVLVGFVGVLIIVRPGAEAFRPEALLVLLSALCFALAMLVTRRMVRSETNAAILFYSTVGGLIANGLLLPLFWSAPTADDLGLFFLLGLLGGVGSFLIVVAYRHAPAAVAAPFDYSALLWSTLIGWLVWRDVPEPAVWLGAAVVVASGLYIIHREALRPRRLAVAPDQPSGPL